MNLVYGNKLIQASVKQIVQQLRYESSGYYFDQIQDKRDYLRVTCPFHKNGKEQRPSCSIYQRTDNDNILPGTLHCFTCGAKCQLPMVVAHCLNLDTEELGKEWLTERFGQIVDTNVLDLPEISLHESSKQIYLNEKLLDNFQYDNSDAINYLVNTRNLSKEIINRFRIGYNSKTNSITFPTWSVDNRLVGIFERSISTKRFVIPTGIDKPVYLLNYIVNQHITKVYIVESCINALTLWGWNKPAIALFGTGTQTQYDILKKSGIRNYILCFDGDSAGKSGQTRFQNYMSDDVIVDVIQIPPGKDVNDLTKNEFEKLEQECIY